MLQISTLATTCRASSMRTVLRKGCFFVAVDRWKVEWREAGREESEERSERKYTNEAPTSFLALPDRDANKANHRARVIPN